MQKLFLSIFVIGVFASSCKNDELVEPVSEAIEFDISCNIEAEDVVMTAGIDGYYMHAYYIQDLDSSISHGVGQFAGKMYHYDEENTHKNLEFRIRNNHFGEILTDDIEKVLQKGDLNYYGRSNEIFHQVQFSVVNSHSIESILWDFGDGQTSDRQNPLHLYLSGVQDKYFVCLTIKYLNGCSDTICSDITLPSAQCSADISVVTDSNRTGLNFNAINLTGQAPYTFEWEFEGGATSNSQQVNIPYTPITSLIEHARLKVTDNNSCTTRVALNYPINNSIDCYSNFNYFYLQEISISDVLGYNNVEIIYRDAAGKQYSSYNGAQGSSSYFRILNYGNYKLNHENIPTKFLEIEFNCTLFDENGLDLQVSSGVGKIAIGHP